MNRTDTIQWNEGFDARGRPIQPSFRGAPFIVPAELPDAQKLQLNALIRNVGGAKKITSDLALRLLYMILVNECGQYNKEKAAIGRILLQLEKDLLAEGIVLIPDKRINAATISKFLLNHYG